MYKLNNGRITLREITDSEEDTDCIVKWRNTDTARNSFFNKSVVTPDIHRNFIRNKKSNDVIFIICIKNNSKIGTIAINVDVEKYEGEYGRTYIDENFRNSNYAEETGIVMLSYCFDILNLNSIWLEVYTNNKAAIQLYKKLGWEDDNYNGVVFTGKMIYTKETWNKNKKDLINNIKNLEV
jgi:RimJ/RimL family protein N-acetyltransferase